MKESSQGSACQGYAAAYGSEHHEAQIIQGPHQRFTYLVIYSTISICTITFRYDAASRETTFLTCTRVFFILTFWSLQVEQYIGV
jgi:hypothetical protein